MSRSTTDATLGGPDEKITPAQIRAKFGELQGEVDSTTAAAKDTVVTIGAVVAVVIVLSVFALGRRRGKKHTTVVEIRRR